MAAQKSGIEAPNYTQVPNSILGDLGSDEIVEPGIMAKLEGSEFKVLMAVCRLTFGFHREERRASLTMIEQFTGLSRQGVVNATKALARAKLIEKSSHRGMSVWRVVVNSVDSSSQLSLPKESTQLTRGVNSVDSSSQLSLPPSKKERNKPEKKNKPEINTGGRGDFDDLKKLYVSEFGTLSPNMELILRVDFDAHGLDSLREAVDVAVINDKRTWSYVRGILRRQAEARQEQLPLIDELPEPVRLSDTDELWLKVKQSLRMQMTQATYDAHIERCELRQANGGYVVVAANELSLEILRNRLHDVVISSISFVSGQIGLSVDFVSQETT